jgi:ADP-ribosylation factor-like protein 2
MGATLLVFLNKTDVEHCMGEEEVREVCKDLPKYFLTMMGFHWY